MSDRQLLTAIVSDKTTAAKEKVAQIAAALLDGTISTLELVTVAGTSKDAIKGTCIEALEYATKQRPEIADTACLELVAQSLADKAPRVKWESAKVIGNIAHRFPDSLDAAIAHLLAISGHTGTVVRWSAAFALGEIVQLPNHTLSLKPALEAMIAREEKNSIRKICLAALKKAS